MKCLICKTEFEYPIKRGRRSRLCGPKCRKKYWKEWHRVYDAQPYAKAKRSKGVMTKYYLDRLVDLASAGRPQEKTR